MDFVNLKSLLSTPEYAGLTDVAAAELANQRRHQVDGATQWTYLGLASAQGVGIEVTGRLIATIDAVAESNPVVAEMRNFLRDPAGGISPAEAATQQMLDAFAANEELPLTNEDAAAIVALGSKLVSDAQRLRLGIVGEQHVVRARMDMGA